jgi:hypothetical protein
MGNYLFSAMDSDTHLHVQSYHSRKRQLRVQLHSDDNCGLRKLHSGPRPIEWIPIAR